MSNPAELKLVNHDATIPPPDNLCVGPGGASRTDIVRLRVNAAGTVERGTLLVSATKDTEQVFLPCAADDLTGGGTFAILADSFTLAEDEHVEIAAYFAGDFNKRAVIFAWEGEDDDHDALAELARDPLRRQDIFLREMHR